jgi:hypothetical protein
MACRGCVANTGASAIARSASRPTPPFVQRTTHFREFVSSAIRAPGASARTPASAVAIERSPTSSFVAPRAIAYTARNCTGTMSTSAPNMPSMKNHRCERVPKTRVW